MQVGIVTQARMGSTRLPEKIMLTCGGKTMLDHHLDRLAWSELPIYIATTTETADEAIADHGTKRGIPHFCGSEADVLERFYGCAVQYELEVIVRVTSDCPLIDGVIIREAVDEYLNQNNVGLYLSNTIERTFPRGFDFEVFHFEMLKEAVEKANTPAQREHVTPYFYQSNRFERQYLLREEDRSHYRLTLDTADDFTALCTLIEQFDAHHLSADQLITLLDDHPEIVAINAHVEQKKV